jgi:hypothetical protein
VPWRPPRSGTRSCTGVPPSSAMMPGPARLDTLGRWGRFLSGQGSALAARHDVAAPVAALVRGLPAHHGTAVVARRQSALRRDGAGPGGGSIGDGHPATVGRATSPSVTLRLSTRRELRPERHRRRARGPSAGSTPIAWARSMASMPTAWPTGVWVSWPRPVPPGGLAPASGSGHPWDSRRPGGYADPAHVGPRPRSSSAG